MKITCNRGRLQTAFQLAASVINSRTIRPVHQNVKMEAAKSALQLVATDGDVDIRVAVSEAEVKESGGVLLPASRVAGILRESSDEQLTIETAEGGAVITGGDSRFRILSEPPDEFPDVASIGKDISFEISAESLIGMIAKTMFAAAQDTTRYSLNGVLFTKKGKNLVLVATDGRRMAKVERKPTKFHNDFADVIVPTKALGEVIRLLQGYEEEVCVSLNVREATFSCGGNSVSARAVAGTFPRFEDAIPVDCDKKAELATAQLLSGVKRAALLTSLDARMVKFTFADRTLVLTSSSVDTGEATITIAADVAFPDMEIAFNPVFIEDVLRVAEGDTITMEMKSKNSQAVIQAGSNYLYVVMPVILPE